MTMFLIDKCHFSLKKFTKNFKNMCTHEIKIQIQDKQLESKPQSVISYTDQETIQCQNEQEIQNENEKNIEFNQQQIKELPPTVQDVQKVKSTANLLPSLHSGGKTSQMHTFGDADFKKVFANKNDN